MGLAILIFVTVLLISDAVSVETQAYFNGTAYLPCPFTKAQNISLSELVVFWQDQQKLVLYEHYLGTEKLDSVNAKYLGRTSFDRDNWTLRLHNVQIKDMGSYDCFIQKKPPTGSIILQQTLTELSVIANFSEPEIKLAQNVTRTSGINLTCTSKQGHPKPKKMYFLITNSTIEHGDNMQISQDNVTELFSISNSLSHPFPDGVGHMTVVCVLETESMKISSKPRNFTLPELPSVGKNWIQIRAIIITLVFVLLFTIIVARIYCKKQNQPIRPSNTTCMSEQDGNAGRESINLEELGPQVASAKPNAE
ncbi:T-lymphocyte activation antigen CD86 isoform X2 [Mus caroli]|nr:T-lymphocyte activation antigen CD86 isoform X2 [Mus caroli]